MALALIITELINLARHERPFLPPQQQQQQQQMKMFS